MQPVPNGSHARVLSPIGIGDELIGVWQMDARRGEPFERAICEVGPREAQARERHALTQLGRAQHQV